MTQISLGDLPRYHAGLKPAFQPALVHPEGVLTWAELDQNSNKRAHLYESLGVKAGDYVSFALPNGNAFWEVAFAIWKLGATPNPLSASLPPQEATAILDLVNPTLLVADWNIPSAVPIVSPSADLTDAPATSPKEVRPASCWKAITSGGSTGRPKVIVAEAPATFDPQLPLMRQPVGGVILNALPLYHNAGFLTSSKALFVGNTVVGMGRFDAEEALRLIERHKVEWTILVPTMMNRIWALPTAQRNRYDLSSLQTLWHGMSFVPRELKRAWIDWLGPEKIWEMYGGTEGQGFTTINGIEWLSRPGSVGKCAPSALMRILREDEEWAAPGEVGEIYFLPADGAGSTYHYLGAEAKRLTDGWESLGDLGWQDEDGYLYLADRRTDMIVRGGANIYPAEVESALEEHPDILSSIVVGLPHPDLGRIVHAIVEPRDTSALDISSLHDFLADRLARYKHPESYEISHTALRDDAGKARRGAVRDERERWLAEQRDFRRFP